MGRIYESTRTLTTDPASAMGHMEAAYQSIGAQVAASDAATMTVTGTRSVGMVSWGERITAHVTPSGGGSSVSVESRLKFGLVDWGRNKKNVEGILDSLSGQAG